jgi:hypothetical protein
MKLQIIENLIGINSTSARRRDNLTSLNILNYCTSLAVKILFFFPNQILKGQKIASKLELLQEQCNFFQPEGSKNLRSLVTKPKLAALAPLAIICKLKWVPK